MVDGLTVMTGTYPARVQLLRYAGLVSALVGVPNGRHRAGVRY